MKQLTTSIFAASIAGTLCAAITASIVSSGSSGPVQIAAAEPDGAMLRRQLDALRRDNSELNERILALEAQRLLTPPVAALAPVRAPVVSATPEEASPAAREAELELAALAASLSDGNTPLPDSFSTRVQEVLEDVRLREESEREVEREERRVARVERQLESLVESLGLDAYQTEEMRIVMLDSNARREELMTSMRETGDWGDMRESMRGLRTESEEAIARFLTPLQLEQYEEQGGGRRFGGGDARGSDRGDDSTRRGRNRTPD